MPSYVLSADKKLQVEKDCLMINYRKFVSAQKSFPCRDDVADDTIISVIDIKVVESGDCCGQTIRSEANPLTEEHLQRLQLMVRK